MKVSSGALFVAFVPVIMASMFQKKTEKLLFWLLLSISVVIINYHIAPKGSLFALTQRVLMVTIGVCMAAQVFGHKTHKFLSPFMSMMLYILFMGVTSMMGWCWLVSELKLFLFMVIFFSFLGAVNQLGYDERVSSSRIRSIMLSFAIFFIFGSMALIPFPGITQMQAEAFLEAEALGIELKSLYCGLTNHSQCLGPVISAAGIVVMGDMLFSVKRGHRLYIALLLCCPYLLYKTSSRTGMGAFLLGVIFLVYLFIQSRGISSRWKSKVMSSTMVMVAILSMVIMASSSFSQGIQKFAAKSGDTYDANTEHILSSRMGLIEHSLYNFRQSPMIGNGFQVSERMIGMELNDFKKLLSAPIEKGVWITAVLEEAGALGWLLLVSIFTVCIVCSIQNRAYIGAACLFTILMINMGEFTMFSMSYSGGFSWAMVFMGLAMDIRRNKDEQSMKYGMMPRR